MSSNAIQIAGSPRHIFNTWRAIKSSTGMPGSPTQSYPERRTENKTGRFLSRVGYLSSRYLQEDDFFERPAAYRAMLGSHYFDDDLRL